MKKILLTLLAVLFAFAVYAADEEENQFSLNGNLSIQSFMGSSDHLNFDDRYSTEFPLTADLELNGKYKVNKNLEFNATGVVGNYMNMLENDPYYKRSAISSHLYYLNGKYSNEGFGELTVGSFGFQVNPYVFKRTCNDWYFKNTRMGSGDYQMLGAAYQNTIGKFNTKIWYGKLGQNGFDDRDLYWQDFALGKLKEYYGAEAGYDFGSVKLSGLYSKATSDINDDKSKIYGGSVSVPNNIADFSANYYEQDTDNLDKTKIWDLQLARKFGKLSTGAKYMFIGENYYGAGDWVFFYGDNNTVKGYEFDLGYDFCDNFNINGYVQIGSEFKDDDASVMRSQWNFNYKFDDANSLTFTWRNRFRKYADHSLNNRYENWLIFKYNHSFSKNLDFMLGYENFHKKQGTGLNNGIIFTQLMYNF